MTDYFDDDRVIEPSELLDKPDIHEYLAGDIEPEWYDVWEASPVEDMSDGQIEALIEMLLDMPMEDWPDWFDADFDYWEWFNENYGGG